MAQKVVFFDVDGTLLNWDYTVSESTKIAIAKARSNGVLCVINTGRPYLHIDPQVKAIPMDGYICSCGQLVLWQDKVLLHESLTPEETQRVVELNRAYGLEVIYESEEGMFFDEDYFTLPYLKRSKEHFGSVGVPVEGNIFAPTFRVDKFSAWPGPKTHDLEEYTARISEVCDVIHRSQGLHECVKKGFSKKTGMDLFCEAANIPYENCYAVGDSHNDLIMLQHVPHSIAMGNATPEVQSVCEYVTTDITDHGILNALAHYDLI